MSIQESKAERILGIFFVVLGILLLVVIIPAQISVLEGGWYNSARFFPYVCAGLLTVLGVFLFWSGWKKKNAPEQETYSVTKDGALAVIVTMGVICVYVGLLNVVPYLPSTIIALAVLLWFFGMRDLKKMIPISVLLPIIIYCSFTYLLKLKLP